MGISREIRALLDLKENIYLEIAEKMTCYGSREQSCSKGMFPKVGRENIKGLSSGCSLLPAQGARQ